MTCRSCTGGWYVRRQRVLVATQHVVRKSGVHLSPVNWRRLGLDGLVFTPNRTLCVDVSVRRVRPHSASNTLDVAYSDKFKTNADLCSTQLRPRESSARPRVSSVPRPSQLSEATLTSSNS
jgi:hypothetical protein